MQVPNVNINLKEEIEELENKPFLFSNGNSYQIEKAIQTIKFELNRKGGEIKSEAEMMISKSAVVPEESKEFLVDNTFYNVFKRKGEIICHSLLERYLT